jgi:hypothetical protein
MVTLCHPTCVTLFLSVGKCSVITHCIQLATHGITRTNLMQTTTHPSTNNAESNLSNLLPHHHACAESDLSDLRPHPSRMYRVKFVKLIKIVKFVKFHTQISLP